MEKLRFLTLDEIKGQCRVDFIDDDVVLALYGRAAEDAVMGATRRTAEELEAMGGGTLPVQLRLAMLLLTAHWYRLREAVSGITQSMVPMAYDYLVKPFVRLTETEEEDAP